MVIKETSFGIFPVLRVADREQPFSVLANSWHPAWVGSLAAGMLPGLTTLRTAWQRLVATGQHCVMA